MTIGSLPVVNGPNHFVCLQDRYELFAGPTYNFQFDRRDFIKAFGAGIVLIVPLTRVLAQQGRGESGRGGSNERLPNDVGAWIHIDEDGGVNVFTGKVEMGQNIRTSLAQAVAVIRIRRCSGRQR